MSQLAYDRILFLRKELTRLNDLYYKQALSEISDQEFDFLMAELIQLERDFPEFNDPTSPTVRVGSDLNNEFVTRKHRTPMLSLSNTYTAEEVKDFLLRCQKDLGEAVKICAELKFDGTSISLTYEDGILQQALTRGDGTQGDDVTANVRTIKSVPLTVSDSRLMEVRGEIVLPFKEFERLNIERQQSGDQLFANPRNAASGTLKQLNSKVVARRKLDAYCYSLISEQLPHDSHYENLQYLVKLGFHGTQHAALCNTLDDILTFINHWDKEREHLPVATDGIVLKVDSIRQQQELGFTSKFPRWAIAYKFKAEQASSVLREVTFQVGRTGTVTPVANLDPVLLSGSIVRRASLYNEDAIKTLDLHLGDTCFVEKGGEIIPKIVGVDKSKRDLFSEPVVFTTHCPECGTPLERIEGEAAYFCPNAAFCMPQILGRIEHFIARKAMNIDGVGPETIVDFLREGLIRNYADLYSLTQEQIMACPRLAKSEDKPSKSKRTFTALVSKKILKAIEASKAIPFEQVLFALGIRYVGETVAKKLAQAFVTLDAIQVATIDQLIQVDEIGERIAQSVVEFFSSAENLRILDQLRQAGLQFELESTENTVLSERLAGEIVVISGVFAHHSRDEYKALIEAHGGKIVSSISSKTTFVLAGENMGPSKLEKAQKLGVTILSEDQFLTKIE